MCATLMCLSRQGENTDRRDKRPAQIVLGVGVAFFRGLIFLLFALFFLLIPGQYAQSLNANTRSR
jgi:hypothetical protein